MIKFLFFITNLLKIFSYIPTSYTFSNNDKNVYLRDTCTCDLTYKVCDRNCCCDPDCDFSKYGIFEDFFEECVESNVILPDSVNLVPICSIEPFVIGDLYNPLSVGYQLLKKGMCLNDKYQELDDNRIKNPEKVINDLKVIENDNEQIDSENIENVFINNFNENAEIKFDYIEEKIENFIFPVMDPSGMCMKGYPIKPGEDKIIICSIQSNNIVNEYIGNRFRQYFTINENKIVTGPLNELPEGNYIVKKVEILLIMSQISQDPMIINLYYEENELEIYDVTFVAKFFSNELNININIPKKSGNIGYLIGSPIRFGENIGNDYINPFYRSRLFIGSKSNDNTCIEINEDNNFYEDFILSNSITFENRTLFTCKGNRALIRTKLRTYLSHILFDGNSLIDYNKNLDSTCENDLDNDNYKFVSIQIFYKFIGLKQNPQRKIIKIQCDFKASEDSEAIYIEFLFIKKNDEIIKKEVPAPYIIRWPQNWLYPFRIGETDYED